MGPSIRPHASANESISLFNELYLPGLVLDSGSSLRPSCRYLLQEFVKSAMDVFIRLVSNFLTLAKAFVSSVILHVLLLGPHTVWQS